MHSFQMKFVTGERPWLCPSGTGKRAENLMTQQTHGTLSPEAIDQEVDIIPNIV